MIRPAARVNLDMVCAFKVGAIDQQPPRAGCPHFAQRDFLFAWHFHYGQVTTPGAVGAPRPSMGVVPRGAVARRFNNPLMQAGFRRGRLRHFNPARGFGFIEPTRSANMSSFTSRKSLPVVSLGVGLGFLSSRLFWAALPTDAFCQSDCYFLCPS